MTDDSDIVEFFFHTATVETYTGTTGKGVAGYSAPQTVPCFITRKLQFVRNLDGEQVASQSSLSAAPSWVGAFTPASRITVDGKTTTVIKTAQPDGGSFITGMDRITAYLQ